MSLRDEEMRTLKVLEKEICELDCGIWDKYGAKSDKLGAVKRCKRMEIFMSY